MAKGVKACSSPFLKSQHCYLQCEVSRSSSILFSLLQQNCVTGMASQSTANRSMLRCRTAPFTALVGIAGIVQFRFHNEKCFPVAFRAWNRMLYVIWCIVEPSCCCWDHSAIARLPCETTASQERMDFIEKLLGDSVQMHGEVRESQDQVRNIARRL